jgi:hypothetical protein
MAGQETCVEILEHVVQKLGYIIVAQVDPSLHDAVVVRAMHADWTVQTERQHVHQVGAAIPGMREVSHRIGQRWIHSGNSAAVRLVAYGAMRDKQVGSGGIARAGPNHCRGYGKRCRRQYCESGFQLFKPSLTAVVQLTTKLEVPKHQVTPLSSWVRYSGMSPLLFWQKQRPH